MGVGEPITRLMYEAPSMTTAGVDSFLNGAELEAAPGAGLAWGWVRAAWRGPHAQGRTGGARRALEKRSFA